MIESRVAVRNLADAVVTSAPARAGIAVAAPGGMHLPAVSAPAFPTASATARGGAFSHPGPGTLACRRLPAALRRARAPVPKGTEPSPRAVTRIAAMTGER